MFQIVKQGAVQVLSGDLPLNVEHIAEVQSLVSQPLSEPQPRMVFDLGSVPFIDSAGLEFMLSLRDGCLRSGGTLQLANAGPLCADILASTGVADHFAIFDDLAAAVGSYAR